MKNIAPTLITQNSGGVLSTIVEVGTVVTTGGAGLTVV